MTFSEQIIYAMFKPSKYKEMVELKARRSVLFVIVLMLVLGIVGYAVPTGALIAGFGGFESLFTEKISDFEFSDGELSIEKSFEMTFDYTNILIDDSVETITDEMLHRDGAYFAIGSKTLRMAYVFGNQIQDYKTIELQLLLPNGFNNQSLVELIPALHVGLVIGFFMICIGYFIKYAIFSLVLSICINSMNKHLELGLSYGKVFMICFYGQTLAIIASNFNAALGLLPVTIVSMVGIFVSIHMITTAVMSFQRDKEV